MSNKSTIEWHPLVTRPLTDEELRYYYDTFGSENIPDYMITGPMPEDGEEILVTYQTKNGEPRVTTDTCACDEWGYYLEKFEDFDAVIAWASLPEAYRPEEEDE